MNLEDFKFFTILRQTHLANLHISTVPSPSNFVPGTSFGPIGEFFNHKLYFQGFV